MIPKTVYLFAGHCQKYFPVKDIYSFAKEYLFSWFPDLPSYQTFNCRLNLLSLADSMPVITSAGRNRTGKAAPEITAKGYCSTKNRYYCGLKLHALVFRRKGTIPFPESIILSPACENDLSGDVISNRACLGDKIYSDFEYFNQ
jgi:hypothetical protein